MQIIKKSNPYIRKDTSTKKIMIDVLIALLPVVVFSVYRFGIDAFLRVLISVTTMIGIEVLSLAFIKSPKEARSIKALPRTDVEGIKLRYKNLLVKKIQSIKALLVTGTERIKLRYKNLSVVNFVVPAISGIIYAMLVPSTFPFYGLIVGAAFAIILAKIVFGGLGNNIFNPAAMGRIFLAVSFAGMFQYEQTSVITSATPLGFGFTEGLSAYSLSDLLFGFIPGSMGEINKIAIIIGAAYLIIRKSADFRVMIATVLSFIVVVFFAGLALNPSNPVIFTLYHVLSGGILFGAVFMVTDPVTSPVTRTGRIWFGALIGVVTAAIRFFGATPEGMAFAIVICNILVPLIDYYKWSSNKYDLKFILVLLVPYLVFIPLFYFGLGVGK